MAVNVAQGVIELVANANQIKGAINDGLASALKRNQQVGRQMEQAGRGLTRAVTVPIVAGLGGAIKAATDFETNILRLSAVVGDASEEQIESFKDVAKELGKTTQFTAGETAEAMQLLAMAGLDVAEVNTAIGPALDLAAAGFLSTAQAADISTNVMTAFRLEATDLERVNDTLVNVANNSNTSVKQLSEALKFAAPNASALGFSLEETVATIGVMGNAGQQATLAGTSLSRIMNKVLAPSSNIAKARLAELGIQVKDSGNETLNFMDIMKQFEGVVLSDADAITLFGERGGPGFRNILAQGSSAIEELTEKAKISGTATEVAAIQMSGMRGVMLRLKSAAEGLGIALAESGLFEVFGKIIERVTEIIRKLIDVNPVILQFATAVTALIATLGPGITVLGFFVGHMRGMLLLLAASPLIAGAIASVAILSKIFFEVFERSQLFRDSLTNLVDVIGSKFVQFRASFEKAFLPVFEAFFGQGATGDSIMQELGGQLSVFVDAMAEFIARIDTDRVASFFAGLALNIKEALPGLRDGISALAGLFRDVGGSISDNLVEMLSAVMPALGELLGLIGDLAIRITPVVIAGLAKGLQLFFNALQPVVSFTANSVEITVKLLRAILDFITIGGDSNTANITNMAVNIGLTAAALGLMGKNLRTLLPIFKLFLGAKMVSRLGTAFKLLGFGISSKGGFAFLGLPKLLGFLKLLPTRLGLATLSLKSFTAAAGAKAAAGFSGLASSLATLGGGSAAVGVGVAGLAAASIASLGFVAFKAHEKNKKFREEVEKLTEALSENFDQVIKSEAATKRFIETNEAFAAKNIRIDSLARDLNLAGNSSLFETFMAANPNATTQEFVNQFNGSGRLETDALKDRIAAGESTGKLLADFLRTRNVLRLTNEQQLRTVDDQFGVGPSNVRSTLGDEGGFFSGIGVHKRDAPQFRQEVSERLDRPLRIIQEEIARVAAGGQLSDKVEFANRGDELLFADIRNLLKQEEEALKEASEDYLETFKQSVLGDPSKFGFEQLKLLNQGPLADNVVLQARAAADPNFNLASQVFGGIDKLPQSIMSADLATQDFIKNQRKLSRVTDSWEKVARTVENYQKRVELAGVATRRALGLNTGLLETERAVNDVQNTIAEGGFSRLGEDSTAGREQVNQLLDTLIDFQQSAGQAVADNDVVGLAGIRENFRDLVGTLQRSGIDLGAIQGGINATASVVLDAVEFDQGFNTGLTFDTIEDAFERESRANPLGIRATANVDYSVPPGSFAEAQDEFERQMRESLLEGSGEVVDAPVVVNPSVSLDPNFVTGFRANIAALLNSSATSNPIIVDQIIVDIQSAVNAGGDLNAILDATLPIIPFVPPADGARLRQEMLGLLASLPDEHAVNVRLNVDDQVLLLGGDEVAANSPQGAALLDALGLIPRAKGGIFDKATAGIFGEAGAEAIIPLTNRFKNETGKLMAQSGLLDRAAAGEFDQFKNAANRGGGVSQNILDRGSNGGSGNTFNQTLNVDGTTVQDVLTAMELANEVDDLAIGTGVSF